MGAQEFFDLVAVTWDGEARWWLCDTRGSGWMTVSLHPAGESVVFRVRGKDVTFDAATSGVGPGYHQHVVGLLERVGASLGSVWREKDTGDETGYWSNRDRNALEQQYMDWIGALARGVLPHVSDAEGSVSLAMPADIGYQSEHKLITATGPRDITWAEAVARDPWVGRDFWPWWEDGATAGASLGRALTLVWCDIPWRAPANDQERSLYQEAADHLQAAHVAGLEIPVPEWNEIAVWAEDPGAIPSPNGDAGQKIGYRRSPVTYRLGLGWSANLPGSYLRDELDMASTTVVGPRQVVEYSVFAQGQAASLVHRLEDQGYAEQEHQLALESAKVFASAEDGSICLVAESRGILLVATASASGADGRVDPDEAFGGLSHHPPQQA